jgi:WD40 repeat protein
VSESRLKSTSMLRTFGTRGSNFEGWFLKSGHSEYKATAPGVRPYHVPGNIKGNIAALAVSKTGKYFAVASGNVGDLRVVTAHEFSPSKGTKVDKKIYGVDFSPSGDRLVFGCKDGSIGLWKHHSEPHPSIVKRAFDGPVNHIEWARTNDRIVAVSTDKTLRVFDDRLEPLVRATAAHKSWIWSATIHRDGSYIVTGSRDRTCRLWHLDQYSMGELQPCGPPLNFGAPVRAVRFSHNGQRLAVGTQDGQIAFYQFDAPSDPASARLVREAIITHSLSAKLADRGQLVKALNYYRQYKKLPILGEHALGRSVFIVALDFSPDDMVLAYGTNIDGYFIYALDLEQRIAGMEDMVGDERLRRYRASKLMYCRQRHRLYVASGPKLHCLFYEAGVSKMETPSE